jgi:hypothetical protein
MMPAFSTAGEILALWDLPKFFCLGYYERF